MQTTSAQYKSIIAGQHRFEWKVVVNGTTTYGQDVIVRSIDSSECVPRIIRQTFGESTPTLGNCISAEFTVTLLLASSAIPRMAMLEPYYRVVNGVQSSEWVQAGVFFIDTREEDEASGTLKLNCYDAMLKANGEDGKPYAELTNFDEWPVSMSSALSEIASLMSVSVDSRTSIGSGSSFVVNYPNDYTMREVLSFIAVANGGSFVMTPAGKLLLVPLIGFNSTTISLARNMSGLRVASSLAAWSKVTIYYNDEEAYEAGSDTGRAIDGDDPWAEQGTADSVLSLIRESSYQPFSADSVLLDPAAELGDRVSFTKGSATLYAHIWSMDLYCNEYATTSVAAPGEDEVDHEYPYVSSADRKMKRMVKLGQPYYGVTISKKNGIEIKRSDGLSEALFNSDVFQMSALINGVMTPRIYFDPIKGDYVFDGALGADAVFTDSLYAKQGDIAELTVDQLSTSRRIKKYLLSQFKSPDYSDDNYIFIKDQYIQFITGTIVSSTGLQAEDGDFLLTESGLNITEETGNVATVQITNRYGQPLYWQREPVDCTSGGYPLDEDGQQIYATTTPTLWPVVSYQYTEQIKAQQAFEQGGLLGNYIPQSVYGAGDENQNSKGYIYKDETSFKLRYVSSRAKNVDITFSDDGFVDAMHRRLSSLALDTGSRTLLYSMEGDNHLYTLSYTVSGDTVTYYWPDGHSCSISIPDDWGDGGEGGGGGGGGSGPSPATNTPYMDGTATAGVLDTYARGDHVHPTDTSRAAVSDIPAAYTGNPVMDGTVSPGTATTWAKGDHVHPTDTSKQDVLTWDSSPTANSSNPVTSDGIKTAIDTRGRVTKQLYASPTSTTPPSITSDTTISVLEDYDDYSYIALLLDVGTQNGYGDRAVVVVPTYTIRFAAHYPVVAPQASGYLRITSVTDQPKQIRFNGTDLSGLWLRNIYGIR